MMRSGLEAMENYCDIAIILLCHPLHMRRVRMCETELQAPELVIRKLSQHATELWMKRKALFQQTEKQT